MPNRNGSSSIFFRKLFLKHRVIFEYQMPNEDYDELYDGDDDYADEYIDRYVDKYIDREFAIDHWGWAEFCGQCRSNENKIPAALDRDDIRITSTRSRNGFTIPGWILLVVLPVFTVVEMMIHFNK